MVSFTLLHAPGFWGGLGLRGPSTAHQHDKTNAGSPESDIRFYMFHAPQRSTALTATCPQCGMNLIPVREGQGPAVGERQLHLSERARQLAEVATSRVERKHVETELRMVGRVTYDETRLSHVTARFPGALNAFLWTIGVKVNEGDHLVDLYSPALLEAQENC